MTIAVSCACGKSFAARDDLEGNRVKCPVCGQPIQVPVRAELADLQPPVASFASSRTLPPAVASEQSPAGFHLVLIGLVAVVSVTVLIGLLSVGIWSMSSSGPSGQPVAEDSDAAASEGDTSGAPSISTGASRSAPEPGPIKTPSPPPVNVWSVHPDPPPQTIDWPAEMKLSLPLSGAAREIVFPVTPSPFVVSGLSFTGGKYVVRWNLLSQQQDGQLQEEIEHASGHFAASADGKYVAAQAQASGNSSLLRIWSFATGKLDRELQCDEPGVALKDFEFAGPDRIVTITEDSGGARSERRLRVWQISTGRQLHEMAISEAYRPSHRAISPGGRYLAVGWMKGLVTFYDLESGAIAGKLALEELLSYSLDGITGLSFAPDGRQLAVVVGLRSTHVVFIDLENGQVVDQFELAGRPPTSSAYKGDAVEWLGDKGWCLFGGSIVDRAARRIVWNLDLPISSRLTPRRTTPTGWIVNSGARTNHRLTFVPIPWEQIDAAVAAMQGQTAAHLKPGGKLTMNIQVGELRFGTPEDTTKRLAEIFQKRFKTDQIEIAEGQPLVLNIRYSETEGGMLHERNQPSAPSKGRTVQATKSVVAMDMTIAGNHTQVWSHELNNEPRIATMKGQEVSDAAARDATFSQLLYTLSSVPIPYYVPADGARGVLPGSTKIED